ncbi:hypothetical protein G6W47_19955 [Streptomyces sp. CAI-21]|uniref:Imm1 family immunity protein n=1 Tax=Streptomyces TaxID=1883 RepID=UPI0009A0A8AD|nr:Imm1 family immunity protein [Streptomyces albidoflavus]MBO1286403.1 hypothetical protein [Streptomyces sampsonii]NUW09179.1 hypothetical protein [Streptomyces sp. CAI-21]
MINARVKAFYSQKHADNPAFLGDERDVDLLIDVLLDGPELENAAELHSLDRNLLPSGFPDHEFLVGVNRERHVGVVSYMDEKNYVSLGSSADLGEGISYFIAGNPTEFPLSSEIPIECVRRAVKEFLFSGGARPECIQWQEPEIW